MPRVKVSKVLSDLDFDKCLSNKEHSLLTNVFDDVETNRARFSLRSGCDDKFKKSIFKDLENSLKKIEKQKINEQGEILTNKLLGTTTSSRKEQIGDNNMDDLVQTGGGRKRRHQSAHESPKKKRKIRKKVHKIKSHRRRGRPRLHKKHKKSVKKRKSHKIKGSKKHHYKHHNIFRNC